MTNSREKAKVSLHYIMRGERYTTVIERPPTNIDKPKHKHQLNANYPPNHLSRKPVNAHYLHASLQSK